MEDFYRKKGRSGSAYCKPCQHAYLREYYQQTIESQRRRRYELAEKYTERNRRFVLEFLEHHGCVDCGERDIMVLEFDHVRGTKIHDVARMIADCFSTERIAAEIAKCVVRCANCHRSKTLSERKTYRALRVPAVTEPPDSPEMWDGWGSNPRPAG